MTIVIIADALQREELEKNELPDVEITWMQSIDKELPRETDAVIDLLFKNDKARIDTLKQFLPNPVIINSVTETLPETNEDFVRINGWNTFLSSSLIEASVKNENKKQTVENIFNLFQKKIEWVPDIVGFVTPRVISMIINEAYFALAEGVSTKDEINTAMKLGTNYPYGPFEWAEKIGLKNIARLLNKLSRDQSRYQPSPLLLSKAEI